MGRMIFACGCTEHRNKIAECNFWHRVCVYSVHYLMHNTKACIFDKCTRLLNMIWANRTCVCMSYMVLSDFGMTSLEFNTRARVRM